MKKMKVFEERLDKAKMNRLAIENEISKLKRSEITRKIQLALTNMEQGELWLQSAIDEASHNPLSVKSYS
jgi:hypothetical protein